MLRYFKAFLDYVRQQGIYIYRGDPANFDFQTIDFTIDSNWHELNLSEIVPEHAKAADCSVLYLCELPNRLGYFRRHGQVNIFNAAVVLTQAAGIGFPADLTIALDSDRKCDYKLDPGPDLFIALTVKGWWF